MVRLHVAEYLMESLLPGSLETVLLEHKTRGLRLVNPCFLQLPASHHLCVAPEQIPASGRLPTHHCNPRQTPLILTGQWSKNRVHLTGRGTTSGKWPLLSPHGSSEEGSRPPNR